MPPLGRPILPTAIASGDLETDLDIYTTASVTLANNRLTLLAIDSRIAVGITGGPKVPIVTGCLEWILVNTVVGDSLKRRASVFKGYGRANSEVISIYFNGQVQTHCGHSLIQFSNTTGRVIQSASNTALTGVVATVTLPNPIAQANNAAFGFTVVNQGLTLNPGTGFSPIAVYSDSTDGTTALTEYRNEVTVVNSSWSGNTGWQIIGVEIESVLRDLYRTATKLVVST